MRAIYFDRIRYVPHNVRWILNKRCAVVLHVTSRARHVTLRRISLGGMEHRNRRLKTPTVHVDIYATSPIRFAA